MCDAVVNDPPPVACTCICEANSLYPGCALKSAGEIAPTPDICPDMMQGRRTMAQGDVAVLGYSFVSAGSTRQDWLLYGFVNDPTLSNGGLGVPVNPPEATERSTALCTNRGFVPPTNTNQVARMFEETPFEQPAFLVSLVTRADFPIVDGNCTFGSPSIEIFRELPSGIKPPSRQRIIPPEVESAAYGKLVVDDFDLDGFDDLLLVIDNQGNPNRPGLAGGYLQVYSAGDTTQCCDAELYDSLRLPGSPATRVPTNDPTTGDFNGDGIKDVAWIGGAVDPAGFGSGSLSVFFASICPGDVPGSPVCEGAEPFEIVFDPAAALFPNVSGATSTIVLPNATLAQDACTQNTGGRLGALAMGNFVNNGLGAFGAPVDELMVIYTPGSQSLCLPPGLLLQPCQSAEHARSELGGPPGERRCDGVL